MKSLRLICLVLGIVAIPVIAMVSCKKEGSDANIPEGQQRIRIRLADNPVNFDAVNVDIQRVEVLVIPDSCRNRNDDDDDDDGRGRNHCHYDHDRDHHNDGYRCSVWDTLDIRAGVYNLLNLSNGVDTLLATGYTLAGKIKKIRLTLGTANSVVIDSVTYPLGFWNGYNRVTITVRSNDVFEISQNDLQLWLDFDAGASIVKVNNNRFVLKPNIKIFVPAQTGSIKGKVLPKQADAVVAVYTSDDTLIAIPDHHSGYFKIRGIRDSTAVVFINATSNGYRDTTITGVSVQRGQETNIGTIQLHQ